MQVPNVADDTLLARVSRTDAAAFRATLAEADYTDLNVAKVLGALEMPTRRARNLPRLRHSSKGDSPLHLLTRLLFVGLPVEEALIRPVLRPAPLEKWVRAGLVALDDGWVQALVRVVPYCGVLLTADPPDLIETGAAPDVVMGMTGSSLTLLYFTVRRRSSCALDLGTGSGVQALVAAGHCEKVWATDNASRSINFARFNARLNGRDNIEFRTGDSYAPVRGRKFDLIITNPPFMISPSQRYIYRDSGFGGDDFCRTLAQAAPRHLREGGYFHMTCEWIHPLEGDWQERIAKWFDGSGCDVYVVREGTQSPASYADQWIRDTELDDPETGARLYQEYLDYYRSLGIQAISTGVVNLRRRSACSNRIRFEDLPQQKSQPFGDWVALSFDLGDALELLADDRLLLAQRVRVSPDVRLDQRFKLDAGGWKVSNSQLRLARGFQFHGNVDESACRLLVRCTGESALIDVLAGLAQDVNADIERVAGPSLILVRELIRRGFLLPEGMEAPPEQPLVPLS